MTVIERPFSDKYLSDLLASNDANLNREIDSLSDEQLLGNSHDYLVAYFLEKYTFESLSLGEEDPPCGSKSVVRFRNICTIPSSAGCAEGITLKSMGCALVLRIRITAMLISLGAEQVLSPFQDIQA